MPLGGHKLLELWHLYGHIYIYIHMYVHMYMYMYVGTYVYVCEPGTLLIICQCVILGQSFIGFLLLFLCGLVMARGLQGA